MPTFYFETDLRAEFSAPQFTRLRHRWRGVRESWKINLEIQQMVFSINSLYARYDAIKARHNTIADLIAEGGALGVNDNTNTPIVLDGLEDLINQVAELQVRVKRLEK